jgi:hypothetical protein
MSLVSNETRLLDLASKVELGVCSVDAAVAATVGLDTRLELWATLLSLSSSGRWKGKEGRKKARSQEGIEVANWFRNAVVPERKRRRGAR